MNERLNSHCKQLIVGGYNIFRYFVSYIDGIPIYYFCRYDMTLLKRCGLLDVLNKLDGPVKVMKRRKGKNSFLTWKVRPRENSRE